MLYTFLVDTKRADIGKWLLLEAEERGWSQSELARRAGLSRTAVNDIINGKAFPGPDFCRAIARALGYPQEFVFRLAGLIDDPAPPGSSPETIALAQLLAQLPPEDREEILTLVKLKLARLKRPHSRPQKQQSRPAPALER